MLVGMPGMHGSKAANWAMNRADLLIACGARFDDRVTGKLDAFAPGARVIHMDVDPAEIDKNRAADIPIVGSLELVVPRLAEAVEARRNGGAPRARPWLEQVRAWSTEHPLRYRNTPPLKPEYVVERLRDLTAGRDVIWSTGVGQHQMWAAQYLRIDRPRRWLTSGGLGTMGFGVPAAIGAKVGRPDALVVNIDGDGCFQMTMQELATARAYGIATINVIMNNGWLGMVRQWQELFHHERYSETDLSAELPDYVRLAEAFGIPGFRCSTPEELDEVLVAAIECGEPCIVDARVDRVEKVYPMVPAGAASSDMIDVEWVEENNEWVEEGV
jgi:acetolactate synthase-1/2/3 large subunit